MEQMNQKAQSLLVEKTLADNNMDNELSTLTNVPNNDSKRCVRISSEQVP